MRHTLADANDYVVLWSATDRPRSVLRRRRARWPLTPEGTAVLVPFAVGFALAWATGLLGLWS